MTEGAGYCMAARRGARALTYTFGEHGHIRVYDADSNGCAAALRFGLELWALAAATGLTCYLAYYLVRMVHVSYLFEDRSDGSDALLIWIPQAPTAFGFAVFAVSLVHALIVALASGKIATRESTASSDGGEGSA